VAAGGGGDDGRAVGGVGEDAAAGGDGVPSLSAPKGKAAGKKKGKVTKKKTAPAPPTSAAKKKKAPAEPTPAASKGQKGRSICHALLEEKKLVFVSLDLETGGENCGIIQISAEIVRLELSRVQGKAAKDTLTGVSRGTAFYRDEDDAPSELFNEYVNPGEDAEWAPAAVNEVSHGLSKSDPRISSARPIDAVWSSFKSFIERNIAEDEHGVVVAYNGAGSDMKWIWRLTQAPDAAHAMPNRLDYYMDPFRMLKKWKSCPLHQSKSKMPSLALSAVWSYINGGAVLQGAHDSLVDAKAQSDLLVNEAFVPFIDRTDSFSPIEKIFGANELSAMKRVLEPIRPVHKPWEELTAESTLEWAPRGDFSYTGSQGGAVECGPSSAVKIALSAATTPLIKLFFLILPLAFFEKVAVWSSKYCYEDWVVEKTGKDRDNIKKKVRYFEPVPTDASRESHHRHRGDKEKEKFKITTGFILCWIGHLIFQGGMFGAHKPASTRLYRAAPHGINVPILRNVMKRDAFTFMRRFIHFCDNSKAKKKGEPGYDALFKVSYALDIMVSGIRKVWCAGQRVTIDESMIKYMGRAVGFVQYMPAKPIKHGIKVFCLCCAYSGVMLAYKIYLGETKTYYIFYKTIRSSATLIQNLHCSFR